MLLLKFVFFFLFRVVSLVECVHYCFNDVFHLYVFLLPPIDTSLMYRGLHLFNISYCCCSKSVADKLFYLPACLVPYLLSQLVHYTECGP